MRVMTKRSRMRVLTCMRNINEIWSCRTDSTFRKLWKLYSSGKIIRREKDTRQVLKIWMIIRVDARNSLKKE